MSDIKNLIAMLQRACIEHMVLLGPNGDDEKVVIEWGDTQIEFEFAEKSGNLIDLTMR